MKPVKNLCGVGRGHHPAHHLDHRTGHSKALTSVNPQMISAGKLDYSPLRHANNLESVRTYEGTDEVHQLTIGRFITGVGAFHAPGGVN